MDKVDTKWANFGTSVGTRLLIHTAVSPIEYAKTLIQIGFEPIPPKPTKTLFGKPALGLPNVFTYVKYIYSVDGTVGLFRGLSPRICSVFLTTVSHSYVNDRFKIPEATVDERDLTDSQKQELFVKKLSKEILATTTSIVVSQPFQVVACRMMAQFIGRETKYSGIFSSFYTILEEEGIWGLFSGLIPRLVGEITTVFLVASIGFAVNSYLVPDDINLQRMFGVGADFLVKSITYPFQVVGVCMAVNNSGLKAGSPPFMQIYSGHWLRCWDDLSRSNQIKRGSGLFWRYYVPPKHTISPFILAPLPEIPKK